MYGVVRLTSQLITISKSHTRNAYTTYIVFTIRTWLIIHTIYVVIKAMKNSANLSFHLTPLGVLRESAKAEGQKMEGNIFRHSEKTWSPSVYSRNNEATDGHVSFGCHRPLASPFWGSE
jgi:hypothetical protein